MFTVEYVDSVDPLVELVQTDPGAVFAKPQMAYLLFLFGEADRETAEWIRRNLRALDSLLGPDIAGAIFVKSFEVRALVRSYYARGNGGTKVHNGEIDLREIRHVKSAALTTPMFDEFREPSMQARRSMEHLTATTYASDEVARSLGVLGELPCVAFLDAMPGPIRCLRLDPDTLPKALTLIRRMLGGLTSATGYHNSRKLLAEAHSAGTQIGSLRRALQKSEIAQREILSGLKNPLIGQLTAAQTCLFDASARRFRHELRQSSLSTKAVERALERASAYASALTHVSRTIRGVSWYADATCPLSDHDRDRLIAVLAGHATEILGANGPSPDDIDATDVRDWLIALMRTRDNIVAKIWGDLPRIEDLKHELAEAIERATREPREERAKLADEARRVSVELEQFVRELGSSPRITEAFDATIGRNHDVAARGIELGPELMERLLKAITDGAVKIVGRDIYIGTNIGAMGPFAKAEGTTFG